MTSSRPYASDLDAHELAWLEELTFHFEKYDECADNGDGGNDTANNRKHREPQLTSNENTWPEYIAHVSVLSTIAIR
jgi:hypothetical protein